MKYTLDTKIRFVVVLGREKEEEVFTIEELGFTQEYLKYGDTVTEKQLQEMYEGWEQNHLDSGWHIAKD